MISKGYLSSYSAWTDIQMVKVLEDTSEVLNDSQKQWVVNVLKRSDAVAKQHGYKKTITVREIKEGSPGYKNAVKYNGYQMMSSNSKSVYYYKNFKKDWFGGDWEIDSLLSFHIQSGNISCISYCWYIEDGCSVLCLVFG